MVLVSPIKMFIQRSRDGEQLFVYFQHDIMDANGELTGFRDETHTGATRTGNQHLLSVLSSSIDFSNNLPFL